ncbi:hypothetical protein FB451DRAFT_1170270 [Mycena latifolia]|nr:hypothetical protein FB451DRAFT_1170270 [Mycena latifolia]
MASKSSAKAGDVEWHENGRRIILQEIFKAVRARIQGERRGNGNSKLKELDGHISCPGEGQPRTIAAAQSDDLVGEQRQTSVIHCGQPAQTAVSNHNVGGVERSVRRGWARGRWGKKIREEGRGQSTEGVAQFLEELPRMNWVVISRRLRSRWRILPAEWRVGRQWSFLRQYRRWIGSIQHIVSGGNKSWAQTQRLDHTPCQEFEAEASIKYASIALPSHHVPISALQIKSNIARFCVVLWASWFIGAEEIRVEELQHEIIGPRISSARGNTVLQAMGRTKIDMAVLCKRRLPNRFSGDLGLFALINFGASVFQDDWGSRLNLGTSVSFSAAGIFAVYFHLFPRKASMILSSRSTDYVLSFFGRWLVVRLAGINSVRETSIIWCQEFQSGGDDCFWKCTVDARYFGQSFPTRSAKSAYYVRDLHVSKRFNNSNPCSGCDGFPVGRNWAMSRIFLVLETGMQLEHYLFCFFFLDKVDPLGRYASELLDTKLEVPRSAPILIFSMLASLVLVALLGLSHRPHAMPGRIFKLIIQFERMQSLHKPHGFYFWLRRFKVLGLSAIVTAVQCAKPVAPGEYLCFSLVGQDFSKTLYKPHIGPKYRSKAKIPQISRCGSGTQLL